MSVYNHPKIFSDLLVLYKKYYKTHQNLPKFFKITIGIEIMKEMIEGLKLITLANFKKNSKEEFKESIQSLRNLRVKIEILKSYFLIAWESKFISHGFYVEVLEKIEEISKQASKWESWLHSQFK